MGVYLKTFGIEMNEMCIWLKTFIMKIDEWVKWICLPFLPTNSFTRFDHLKWSK